MNMSETRVVNKYKESYDVYIGCVNMKEEVNK